MTNITYLNKKNNRLKSELVHKQLGNNTYSFQYSRKEMLKVLNAYKIHKSIFKAASSVGIDPNIAMKWYEDGINENSLFRGFYLAVNEFNGSSIKEETSVTETVPENVKKDFDGEFKFSRYGDGWSYTTYVDGEKIFIISDELDTLKEKVQAKNLPMD